MERARATFLPMDRPRVATVRPLAMAASAICWIRWMWLAKQATMTRLSGWAAKRSASTRPTLRSLSVWPSSSALVESDSSRRIPELEAMAPMRARSVARPSTGVRSILKSPECRMTPCGVWKAVAKPWGTEWVTGMNSTSNGPILRRSPSWTGMSSVRPSRPASSMRLRARPSGQRRAVDRELQLAQQEAQAAAVVLVAVGDDAPLDPVGVLEQVREVGEDQVDAGHVRVGEHDPAVEDHDAARRPRCRRSCARSRPGPRGRRPVPAPAMRGGNASDEASTAAASSEVTAARDPCGSAALPGGQPQWPQHGLGREPGWGLRRSTGSGGTRSAGR